MRTRASCGSPAITQRAHLAAPTPTSLNMSAASMSATLAVGKVPVTSRCVASRARARTPNRARALAGAFLSRTRTRERMPTSGTPSHPPGAPPRAPLASLDAPVPDPPRPAPAARPPQVRPQGPGLQVQVRRAPRPVAAPVAGFSLRDPRRYFPPRCRRVIPSRAPPPSRLRRAARPPRIASPRARRPRTPPDRARLPSRPDAIARGARGAPDPDPVSRDTAGSRQSAVAQQRPGARDRLLVPRPPTHVFLFRSTRSYSRPVAAG